MRPGVAVNVNCIRTLMINMTGQYIVNKSYLGFERYESKGHYYSLQCLVTLNRDFYE
jgi:hypothetical protein